MTVTSCFGICEIWWKWVGWLKESATARTIVFVRLGGKTPGHAKVRQDPTQYFLTRSVPYEPSCATCGFGRCGNAVCGQRCPSWFVEWRLLRARCRSETSDLRACGLRPDLRGEREGQDEVLQGPRAEGAMLPGPQDLRSGDLRSRHVRPGKGLRSGDLRPC